MSNDSVLVRALYDFESGDPKVLCCSTDDKFVIIKHSKPPDWLYVVNAAGKLGYIPTNYSEKVEIDDCQYLDFIDSIISLLDAKNNDSSIVTIRQINHAQVKLTQLRCEVVQRIFKKTSSPEPIEPIEPLELLEGCDRDDKVLPISEAKEENNLANGQHKLVEACTQTDDVNVTENIRKTSSVASLTVISDSLIADLMDRLRVSTELSHPMCKLTIHTVISCLKEEIPSWSGVCDVILDKLDDERTCSSPEILGQSSDLFSLKTVFKNLWYCKNDDQQRSWPVHEDEEIIKGYLQDLCKLLSNANPVICRQIISKNNYDNIQMLVTYFQMETRRSLHMELYLVFMEIITLVESVISEFLLNTVLPATVAAEMLNYKDDTERWTKAAALFTAVFSSGNKPPINIYEQINENFIMKLLDIVEREDINGESVETEIPPEASMAPIVSFNLHFDDPETNLVLKALKMRHNASRLTENLVSYLNWEEDVTQVCREKFKATNERPNAVHKILIEMFADTYISKLFYSNDVRVVIDIIITNLNNLPAGDEKRLVYLKLIYNIVKNTSYKEDTHKIDELMRCFTDIENHECSSDEEKDWTTRIKDELSMSPESS